MARKTRIIRHAVQNVLLGQSGSLAVSLCLLLALFQSSPVGGQIIVANHPVNENGYITIFERGDDGDVAPVRVIVGSATGLYAPYSVAVDLENHELFVLNNGKTEVFGSITVYDLDDDGNVSPKRTLQPTGPFGLLNSVGLAVDPINDELYIHEDFGLIHVFDRAASGSATPLRTLDWSDLSAGQGDVALDLVNDELFVLNSTDGLLVFPRTASGDDQPIRKIVGSNTGLGDAKTLVVDPVRDELIVGGGSSIRVFSRSADGNVEPLRVIEGPATGLSHVGGIALDPSWRTIYATLENDDAVVAFPRTAVGNVPPLRTIIGTTTNIDNPFGCVVSGFVFEDGFENGDVNDWSNAVP